MHPRACPRVSAVGVPLGTEELPGTGAQGTTPRDSPLGTFSQIAGIYTVSAQLPVKVEVCWTVTRNGAIATDCCLGSNSDAREFSVAFLPPFAELVAGAVVPTAEYEVVANIVLTANTQSYSFALSVPVSVPCVPVPAVAALFRHYDFAATDDDVEGFVAVVVPHNSPFNEGQHQLIFTALDTLYGTLADLASVATDSYAASLLLVDVLRSILRAQPSIRVRRGGVSLYTLFTWLDDGAEGRISSMILLGPPGKVLQCYNRRAYQTDRGWFEISPGRHHDGVATTWGPEIITIVRNIHSTAPASAPTGQEIVTQITNQPFDNMHSARFAQQALPAPVVPPVGNRPATACELSESAKERLADMPKRPGSWKSQEDGEEAGDKKASEKGGKGTSKKQDKAADAESKRGIAGLRAEIEDLRSKRLDREEGELRRRDE